MKFISRVEVSTQMDLPDVFVLIGTVWFEFPSYRVFNLGFKTLKIGVCLVNIFII